MIPQFEPLMQESYINQVTQTMRSGWIGSGKEVTKFEDQIAEYTKSNFAIATSSGTTALLTILEALKLRKKVIAIPNYSFIAATNVVRFLNNTFKIIDINFDTLCMSPQKLQENLPVDAVIFINHNGYVGPRVNEIKKICDTNNILFIEDAACALGQVFEGKHAGTQGIMSCFSFSVPKLITTGQGGMIITNDSSLAKRSREIIDQGSTTWRQDQFHYSIGLNFKLGNIPASYGIAQLNIIEELLQKRSEIHERFKQNLPYLHTYETDNHTGTWMNILKTEDAEKLVNHLKKFNIESKMYYKPIDLSIGLPEMVNTFHIYKTRVYLPSSLTLTTSDIDYICEIINEY